MDAEEDNSLYDNSDEEIETPVDSQLGSEKYLIGFVLSQIVGIKYYNGKISGREMVALVREPLNAYDPNAIRVLNTRTIQVGHIERIIAAVLAPLIDQHLITVEGIVPNYSKGGSRFKLPLQVHIFSRIDQFRTVQLELSRGGLHLISHTDAGFGLSEAVVVKDISKGKKVQQVDEIFNLVNEEMSKKKLKKLEPPEDIIKSKLLPHQKEGLGWLVYRETSNDLPPFWEEKDGVYINVLTNYQTYVRPDPLRGGILADDMGLGKTLTLLSLIALDKPTKNPRKKQKVENHSLKTTLVVCPPSVISTWVGQLAEHTNQGSMKMYMYYGERTDDPKELEKYDIVLTTYTTLASEETWELSPLKQIEWWRVVLDEAHIIRNVKTQQSRAVTNLRATMRWAVTGTPIQNGFFDLFAFMTFLRFEPFSIRCYWRRLVSRPLAQEFQLGLARLQTLIATMSLRRTKEGNLVGLLPEKSVETYYVELSSEERALYDQLEDEARVIVSSYIRKNRLTNNYMTVLSIILRLRQICIDVALCPADLKFFLPSDEIEDVKNRPELLEKLVALLQEGEDFDCPICISPTTNMIITSCAHIFCKTCILKTLKNTKRVCPLCRHPLTESDLFSAPPNVQDIDTTTVRRPNLSSKVSQLLKHLRESRNENPSRKSVIFSQFRKMLILLEEPLREAGFKFLRLDGSMNAKKRGDVIKEFSVAGGEATVLLASLKSSGTGINLTVASRVYFVEPWWNPAAEEQAMDRVHRIGQLEKVKVVRFIAKDTVEERMVELQEHKKADAREAFEGVRGRIKMDHIKSLISLK